MRTPVDVQVQRKNLDELRSSSLRLMAFMALGIGLVWFLLVVWPATGGSAPPLVAWLGGLLLLWAAFQALLLSRRALVGASVGFIGGVLGAAICATMILRVPHGFYALLIPLILSSALLGRLGIFWMALLASFLVGFIGTRWFHVPLLSGPILLPILIIQLTAGATWLTARNLYTALSWVWSGYERAQHNEQLAREGQAELRRTLKALEEATYRLERANQMLATARAQAEEARRLKQRFAQTISHELRTPLNLIVGFTEMMAQSPEYYGVPLPSAYLRDLMIVHRNACHLQDLVNDVLDLARIEAAEMPLLPEEVDPASLAQEAIQTARSLVESRGLRLCTEIEHNLPRVYVDPTRIRQVLFNLLNNAARFTERGSVTVRVGRQGDQVIFAVSDTGIGIAPSDLTRIFEEFEQADDPMRRRHGGAGLGLAISKRFVELHGGRIWAESQVGKGSTFYFTLPCGRHEPLAEIAGRLTQTPPPTPYKRETERILLTVTRSPAAAALISRYVRGCRNVVLQDLEQARGLASKLLPQGVILDTVERPLGPEELQTLAQTWSLPHTWFLAAALPGESSLKERLDVEGYLIKPISQQEVQDVLRPFGEKVDRILLVDDDRDFLRLMSRLLDNPLRRYQVFTATSGHKALALLAHQAPDVILLDLVMPDMDGLEVLRQIRTNPAWRNIPVIIVTAQEEINTIKPVVGPLLIAKAGGLASGELVRWVQALVGDGEAAEA
jgi:signal transduction histidine kinase/CheY-like chemotaxis protein